MARTITLGEEKTIVYEPAKTITTTEVTLLNVVDDGSSVIALVQFEGWTKQYALWNDATPTTYEQIGQWTDANVNSRLIELL